MELKVRLLKWSAGIPVVMLNLKTAEKMGIHKNDRISIEKLSRKDGEFSSIVDIVEKIIKEDEIGISSEIKELFSLREGQRVDVNIAKSPVSLSYIRKKVDKKKLSKEEIKEIIKDIVNNSLSDPEIALFVSGMYENKMNLKETISLIEAFIESGDVLSLPGKFIVDKHCIGGIPGNRTTPIVVSICAAAGLTVPKTSSKAITSATGTADVIESIAQVEFSIKELKKIIRKTGAFLVWGGSLELVPADSKIIRVERILKIDPYAQLLASIMAKKIAVGSKYLIIDIPYGKTAKVNKKSALKLKKSFERLGKHFKIKLKVVLTKGDQPIGNGIGPILELMDVIKVLNPFETGGPKDLREKSLFLAGQLLEMTGKTKKGKGFARAEEILDSGKAFKKFVEIIKAQNGSIKHLELGKFKKDILASSSLRVESIDNIKINLLARIAGCPVDKSSGLYLSAHVGNKLKKGSNILTIYAESRPRLQEAIDYYKREKPIIFK
ncbi:MAG: AMP phosphorylase [Candidatus Diapherotrites archaeon]